MDSKMNALNSSKKLGLLRISKLRFVTYNRLTPTRIKFSNGSIIAHIKIKQDEVINS